MYVIITLLPRCYYVASNQVCCDPLTEAPSYLNKPIFSTDISQLSCLQTQISLYSDKLQVHQRWLWALVSLQPPGIKRGIDLTPWSDLKLGKMQTKQLPAAQRKKKSRIRFLLRRMGYRLREKDFHISDKTLHKAISPNTREIKGRTALRTFFCLSAAKFKSASATC